MQILKDIKKVFVTSGYECREADDETILVATRQEVQDCDCGEFSILYITTFIFDENGFVVNVLSEDNLDDFCCVCGY